MEIKLNLLGFEDSSLDLSKTSDFLKYYHSSNTYTKYIIDNEINNGHYNDVDFLSIFKNKDSIVIDGGSNVGLFSLHLHKLCKKIYAVEPTESHINILKNLCQDNDIKNIKFYEMAFNKWTGSCSFQEDAGNTTSNKIANDGFNMVKCSTIYDFILSSGEKTIDLLKLDIEGGELPCLLEDSTFEKCVDYCKNIYIEVHPEFCASDKYIEKLSLLGYKHKFLRSEYLNTNLNILFTK